MNDHIHPTINAVLKPFWNHQGSVTATDKVNACQPVRNDLNDEPFETPRQRYDKMQAAMKFYLAAGDEASFQACWAECERIKNESANGHVPNI